MSTERNNVANVTTNTTNTIVELVKNSNAPVGVELHVTTNGKTETLAVKITKDKICYELPTNPSNRKWVNIKNFNESGKDVLVLEYKEPRKLAPHTVTRTAPKDLLSKEDQKLYDELMKKIADAREAKKAAARQPMSELEKAKRAAERAKAKFEALKAAAKQAKESK